MWKTFAHEGEKISQLFSARSVFRSCGFGHVPNRLMVSDGYGLYREESREGVGWHRDCIYLVSMAGADGVAQKTRSRVIGIANSKRDQF